MADQVVMAALQFQAEEHGQQPVRRFQPGGIAVGTAPREQAVIAG